MGWAEPTAGGAALALLIAVTAFVGFESSSVLGVESRRPLLHVPRAVLWTPALGGVVLLTGPRQRPPVDHLDAARGCARSLEPLLA